MTANTGTIDPSLDLGFSGGVDDPALEEMAGDLKKL